MTYRIAYPNNHGGISIVMSNKGIEACAAAVPDGVPYRIIPDGTDFPPYELREAFEMDFSEPDGYGVPRGNRLRSSEDDFS